MMFRGITVNCLQLRFYPLLHCIPFYNKYRGVLKIVQVRALKWLPPILIHFKFLLVQLTLHL